MALKQKSGPRLFRYGMANIVQTTIVRVLVFEGEGGCGMRIGAGDQE